MTAPEPRLLNWRDASHYARAEAPCTYCHEPTHLRETPTRPAHKTCAEAAIARKAADVAAAYRKDTL